MGREKYKLEWQTFQNHSVNLNRNLFNDTAFSDVILMTDELVQTPAHKVILSAASTVFKELCAVGSKSVQQILYLRGIKQEELDAMLQFIYLGEATVYEDRLKEFSRVVRDFNITKLNEFQYLQDQVTPTKKKDTPQEEKDDSKKKDQVTPLKKKDQPQIEKDNPKKKEENKETNKIKSKSNVREENTVKKVTKKAKVEEPAKENIVTDDDSVIEDPFLCLECELVFNDKAAFDHHYQATHVQTQNEDSKQKTRKRVKKNLSCLFCPNKFESREELLSHLKGHDLPYYPCQICDFVTNKLFKLKNHIKKIHEMSMKEYSKRLEGNKPEQSEDNNIQNEDHAIDIEASFGQDYDEVNGIDETRDNIQQETELPFVTSDMPQQMEQESTFKPIVEDFQQQKCLKCHQMFTSREAMSEHFRLVFPTEKYHCPDQNCDQQFESKNLVKFHVNDAHKDIRFKCVQCNIQFSKENILKNHMKRMHQGA